MKKIILLVLVFILSVTLISCKSIELEDNYDDNTFGYININKDSVKILQLTDIHLTYGFDYLDRKTFTLIDKLIKTEEPDIIVITGDLFMSVLDKSLLKQFVNFIEQYKIYWTLTFGNHESEYTSSKKLAHLLVNLNTEYLLFHYGPSLSLDNTHGYSNFKIKVRNNSKDLFNIYMLDTKANRTDGIKDDRYPYDYLSLEQVSWYINSVSSDLVGSLAFMHIPLMEYLEYDGVVGEMIWPQGKNTGFFSAIKNNNTKTKGVFSGHDHLNDFEFLHEDVLLAYGLSSGYNAYGIKEKGGRVIVLSDFNNTNFTINTYLVKDSEVLKR